MGDQGLTHDQKARLEANLSILGVKLPLKGNRKIAKHAKKIEKHIAGTNSRIMGAVYKVTDRVRITSEYRRAEKRRGKLYRAIEGLEKYADRYYDYYYGRFGMGLGFYNKNLTRPFLDKVFRGGLEAGVSFQYVISDYADITALYYLKSCISF